MFGRLLTKIFNFFLKRFGKKEWSSPAVKNVKPHYGVSGKKNVPRAISKFIGLFRKKKTPNDYYTPTGFPVGRPRIHDEQPQTPTWKPPIRWVRFKERWSQYSDKQKEYLKQRYYDFLKTDPERNRAFDAFERYVDRRVKFISDKFFKTGKLTSRQWQFVKEYAEFFPNVKRQRTKKKTAEPKKWYRPRKASSWIIRFQYQGEVGNGKKGMLLVEMERGKMWYPFPHFPYEIFMMLCTTEYSVGRYWWRQWLWKYGKNSRYMTPDWKQRQRAIFNRHKGI